MTLQGGEPGGDEYHMEPDRDFDSMHESDGSDDLLDSFGSGSGLLDLSLQADDTSLGGILDEIYRDDVDEALKELDDTSFDTVAEMTVDEEHPQTGDDGHGRYGGLRKELAIAAAELAESGKLLHKVVTEASDDKTKPHVDAFEVLSDKDMKNPVKRLLNLFIVQAIRDGASDMYVEDFGQELKVRYKIDGVLYEMVPPPRDVGEMLGDELERLFGRLREEYGTEGRLRWLRRKKVTRRERLMEYGENPMIEATLPGVGDVVLSLSKMQSESGDQYRLKIFRRKYQGSVFADAGKSEGVIEQRLLQDGGGLVLVTGLPGHGKTTTAHDMLYLKSRPDKMLVAVGGEPPAEGIHHIDKDLRHAEPEDVATAIESYNADMVYLDDMSRPGMVGLAIDLASRMGKTVIGGLDADDLVQGAEYLVRVGVGRQRLAGVLRGGTGQRLFRRIHQDCRTKAGFSAFQQFRGRGCGGCNNTGFKGRIPAMQVVAGDNTSHLIDYIREGKPLHQHLPPFPTIYREAEHLARSGAITVHQYWRTPKPSYIRTD